MNADPLCEFDRRGSRFACSRCDQPSLSASLPLPIRRVCRPKADAPALIFNFPAETGPCVHRGKEPLRIEACQRCGSEKGNPVPIYRCHAPNAPAAEISETRHKIRQLRSETCNGCGLYEPAAMISIEGTD